MQLSQKFKSRLTKAAIAILLIWLLIVLFNIWADRNMVANILNLKETPSSVKNQECESWGFTDILDTCYIEISPQEFPLLLKGFTYQESQQYTNSHEVLNGPKVGQEFKVTKQFIAEPKEFKYGGYIRIYTNSEMNKAILDLYIE
jgi:hypothetical protein